MLPPQLLKLAEDSAVVAGIAIAVVLALPRDDGGEVRWMLGGDAPLIARVVRDAEHADLAVAPRLGAGPLDALVKILDLARGVRVHDAGRPAGAARVDTDHHIAVRYPALRISDLPVLIFVGRAVEDLRVILDHFLPLVWIPLLIRQALGVHSVGEDDRIAPVVDRAKHVRTQHDTVIHHDRLVPGDPHAVPHFGAGLDLGPCHFAPP